MGKTATRKRTSVKRQAGESSSQCADTNSKTPAQSNTPPSATASSTGQRRRSLELCESSNVRMRAAVLASTPPAESHRSSRLSSASAMRGSPLVSYSSPMRYQPEVFRSKNTERIVLRAACSWRALLVHHQHAGFGVIRRWNIVKRHVNVFAFGFAILDQHGRDAFRNFPFLLRCPAFHPGDLHVRHVHSSLERVTLVILHAKRWHSIRRRGSRKVRCIPVLELSAHAPGDSSPYRAATR